MEPEAASLFCRRVPVGVETQGDGRKVIAAMNVGAKYIVLDQGGMIFMSRIRFILFNFRNALK